MMVSTTFINITDTTKKIKFSLSGLTTGTIRTYFCPDASTTFVGIDNAQTLTNKTFNCGSTYFIDATDPINTSNIASDSTVSLLVFLQMQILSDATKKCIFSLYNLTSNATRTLTIPCKYNHNHSMY